MRLRRYTVDEWTPTNVNWKSSGQSAPAELLKRRRFFTRRGAMRCVAEIQSQRIYSLGTDFDMDDES